MISCAVTAKLILSTFGFALIGDRTNPFLFKLEISSFWPSSVTVQAGPCKKCSESQKNRFLVLWLNCFDSYFVTGAALSEFTTTRSVDAKAMCDLAFYNYVEVENGS